MLGLFGVVVINIFQNVTVDNDRVYYLIKESTEASAYYALDLMYYRLSGNLRIVEDVNEMSTKVSLRVISGITYNKSQNPINNPINDCMLNDKAPNCLSKTIITVNNVVTSYVNTVTTEKTNRNM